MVDTRSDATIHTLFIFSLKRFSSVFSSLRNDFANGMTWYSFKFTFSFVLMDYFRKIFSNYYQIITQEIDFLGKRKNRCHFCLPVIRVQIKAAKCRSEKCLMENVIESIMFTTPLNHSQERNKSPLRAWLYLSMYEHYVG